MKLNKLKKAELIDIILRKDEVEAKLREENKQLSEAFDDVEHQLEIVKTEKFDKELEDAENEYSYLNNRINSLINENIELNKKVKRLKYTFVTTFVLLVASVIIGFVL